MSKNSKKKKEKKIVIFSEEDINKKTYGNNFSFKIIQVTNSSFL